MTTFTLFVEGKNLESPLDRQLVIAALDQLVSAIEGIAIGRGTFNSDDTARAHALRRDIRRLATGTDSPALLKQRVEVFVATARLLRHLDSQKGPTHADRALVDAVELAADGLDRDYPTRLQGDALQNFFGFSAKALKQLDDRRPAQR